MKFDVTIPQWSEGKPMTFKGIEADTAVEATAKTVNMVNQIAGYHYCDNLPVGTTVIAQKPPEGCRTVDEICKTRAKREIFAGYYGDDKIPKVCPYCNGEIVLRRKIINQEDTVPVGICAKCDIAWLTKDRN